MVHIHLYHYPIAEWEKFYHGGYLIYGHIHGRTDGAFEYMKTQNRAFNAFCGINGYEPVTIEELAENNKAFIRKHSIDEKESER